MGLLDSLEGAAGQQVGGGQNGQVAGGLMQALEEHPGGLGGLMAQMQRNGVDPNQMAQQGQAAPGQVSQGLQGSGLVASVAQKAGISPQVAEEGLAIVLPMVMAHFTQGGTTPPPSSGLAGMAGGLLSRFL